MGMSYVHPVRVQRQVLLQEWSSTTSWTTHIPRQDSPSSLIFTFRQRGREGERERNIDVWLPLTHSVLGTQPTTQEYTLTGNLSGDPLVHRLALNPLATPTRAGFGLSIITLLMLRLSTLLWLLIQILKSLQVQLKAHFPRKVYFTHQPTGNHSHLNFCGAHTKHWHQSTAIYFILDSTPIVKYRPYSPKWALASLCKTYSISPYSLIQGIHKVFIRPGTWNTAFSKKWIRQGLLAIKSINVSSSKHPQHPAHTLVINLPYKCWFCIFILASHIRTSDSQ